MFVCFVALPVLAGEHYTTSHHGNSEAEAQTSCTDECCLEPKPSMKDAASKNMQVLGMFSKAPGTYTDISRVTTQVLKASGRSHPKKVSEAFAFMSTGTRRRGNARLSPGILRQATVDISLVQVPNYHILTQNLYLNSYHQNPKYLITGYLDP